MKLNLGAGRKRIDGFLNVDNDVSCEPDLICDLNVTPWTFGLHKPQLDERKFNMDFTGRGYFKTNAVDHIIAHHILEHLGPTADSFFAIIKEMYRVCCDGAIVDIIVPYPGHDSFWSDPTHVRPITVTTMAMFDRKFCEEAQAKGLANSPLALQLGVDFRLLRHELQMDDDASKYLAHLNGTSPLVAEALGRYGYGVVTQTKIQMQVIK